MENTAKHDPQTANAFEKQSFSSSIDYVTVESTDQIKKDRGWGFTRFSTTTTSRPSLASGRKPICDSPGLKRDGSSSGTSSKKSEDFKIDGAFQQVSRNKSDENQNIKKHVDIENSTPVFTHATIPPRPAFNYENRPLDLEDLNAEITAVNNTPGDAEEFKESEKPLANILARSRSAGKRAMVLVKRSSSDGSSAHNSNSHMPTKSSTYASPLLTSQVDINAHHNSDLRKVAFEADSSLKSKMKTSLYGSDFDTPEIVAEKEDEVAMFPMSIPAFISDHSRDSEIQDPVRTSPFRWFLLIHRRRSSSFVGLPLRKTQLHSSRPRSNTEGISESTMKKVTQIPEEWKTDTDKRANVIITLPNFRSIMIRSPTSLLMEDVLLYLSKKHNFEFEEHTFSCEGAIDANVEMDRSLSHYVNDRKISEFFVVPEQKVYRSKYVSENNRDVLLLHVIQGRNQVVAGTPEKLIEILTDPTEKSDIAFLDTLLLTFRSFMPAIDLFKHLLKRFLCVPPENPTEDELEFYNVNKVPTQLRVVSVLIWWTRNYWHDFSISADLKTELEEFCQDLCTDEAMRSSGFDLLDIIESQTTRHENIYTYYRMIERKGKTMQSMFLDLTPEELSQQICLHNFKLFNNIPPIEFLNQIWNFNNKDDVPMLKFFIERFDYESYWVATEILSNKDLKKRVNALKNFIFTAKASADLNNFFTLFAFAAGLSLSPVSRLKKTWEVLPEKAKITYEEIEVLTDPTRNMKNFRDALAKATPPMIPFLPIYLKDLTFMNDGNPKLIDTMINFDKLRMMGNRVKELTKLAETEYKFAVNPEVQNYISKPPIERQMARLKEMSLECEK